MDIGAAVAILKGLAAVSLDARNARVVTTWAAGISTLTTLEGRARVWAEATMADSPALVSALQALNLRSPVAIAEEILLDR